MKRECRSCGWDEGLCRWFTQRYAVTCCTRCNGDHRRFADLVAAGTVAFVFVASLTLVASLSTSPGPW